MEDFSTRTYGTSGLDNRPLFGETSAKVSADLDSGLGTCVCLCVCPPAQSPGCGPGTHLKEESAGSSILLPS